MRGGLREFHIFHKDTRHILVVARNGQELIVELCGDASVGAVIFLLVESRQPCVP